MLVVTFRTDKPEAEIGLFEDQAKTDYVTWQAHRELSNTLLIKLKELLEKNNKTWADVEGVVIYKGPGSFTGLRIGFSVANTIAYSEAIPVVSSSGDAWIVEGIERLKTSENEKVALPEYGGEANTTKPRK